MANLEIACIPAFSDNYIWCIHDTKHAFVVDPGQAGPVEDFLDEMDLELSGVLVTHHHPDHVGGITQLQKTRPALRILGARHAKYKGITEALGDGESSEVLGHSLHLVDVPGHTLDHVAYVGKLKGEHAPSSLFCGDTLFSGGCGRLFEGSPVQMHSSLSKLKALPESTEVYCAHEYTLANLAFAKTLMPNNTALNRYIQQCESKRARNEATIPSTIGTELAINPFLRDDDAEIIENLRLLNYKELGSAATIFAAMRDAKDRA